ncbi:hypothetical protein SCHPADRAFT_120080 [Schizopora paradoxa]|uniref:F-box domain-containing protein n=1 Tax=Schizopora paradoxa TaxID=27342 RepID=A0A0H2SN51_9AGAM|nr:hypothetical protein SCHPADRAFT_120080 [Schizopora paradoxa]
MAGSDFEAAGVDTLISMLKTWRESGFKQILDESQRKQIAIIDGALEKGFPQPADEASIKALPHSAASLQKTLNAVNPTISKFYKLVAAEIKEATERTRRITMMCGVAALSDDVLARIIDIAVTNNETTRARTAVAIARVSRRFRIIALSNHALWSFIYWSTDLSSNSFYHIFLCLERSSQTPLEIMFNDTGYDGLRRRVDNASVFTRFIKALLPHVNRWKSFTIDFRGNAQSTTDICNTIAGLDAPQAPLFEKIALRSRFRARELFIGSSGFPIPFFKWPIANLRDLELRDFTVDVTAYPMLERFYQAVVVPGCNFKNLFEGLMTLKSLNYLHLGIFTVTIANPNEVYRLDLPSLTELSLFFRVKITKPFDSIISAFNCPNVTDLKVQFIYFLDDEDDWAHGLKMEVTQHHIRHLFSPPDRFRKIEKLTFSVSLSEAIDADEGDIGHMLYAVPFPHLPNLRELHLDGSLASLRPHIKNSYAQKFEIDETDTYPAVEIISVRSFGSDRLYDWIGKVMKKLEKQGDWEKCFKYLELWGKHTNIKGQKVYDTEYFPRELIPEWVSFWTK